MEQLSKIMLKTRFAFIYLFLLTVCCPKWKSWKSQHHKTHVEIQGHDGIGVRLLDVPYFSYRWKKVVWFDSIASAESIFLYFTFLLRVTISSQGLQYGFELQNNWFTEEYAPPRRLHEKGITFASKWLCEEIFYVVKVCRHFTKIAALLNTDWSRCPNINSLNDLNILYRSQDILFDHFWDFSSAL